MKIKKYITLSIGVVVILLITFIFVIKPKLDYDNDVKLLYSVADKLGYESNNQVYFGRSYASGIDANYDIITVIFSFHKTLENFSTSVKALSFQQQEHSGPGQNSVALYLLSMGMDNKGKLTLGGLYDQSSFIVNTELSPIVTTWGLATPFKKTLKIQYLETNKKKDLWGYGNKQFQGNIVVISLDRNY